MAILAIDTSTSWMCVALEEEGKIIEIKELNHNDHSSKLMPAIEKLMNKYKINVTSLEKIIVGNGPGSYTGTRIGVTVAKTMAWGLDIPIVPVSTLKLFAYSQINHEGLICAMQDAKRRHVFASAYQPNGQNLEEKIEASYVHISDVLSQIEPSDNPVFIGLNIDQYEEEIMNDFPNALIVSNPDEFLSAKYLFPLAKSAAEIPAHDVKPNYLRLTQAEANLASQQKVD